MSKLKIVFKFLKFSLPFLILSLGFCVFVGHAQNIQEVYPAINNISEETYDSSVSVDPLDSTPVVSMDFKDAFLMDVLKAFSIQSGINFVASQTVKDRKVTVYFDKVSVKEAMDKLFKANNLDYDFYEKDRIILVKKAEPIKAITKVYPLKHARVTNSLISDEMSSTLPTSGGAARGGITPTVAQLLSAAQGESLIEDARTNALIITALPEKFPILEKAIRELDIPVPQVMLEVEMLDVSKSVIDKLGFEFDDTPFTLILPGQFVNKGARFFMGDLSDRGAGIDDAGIDGSVVVGDTYAGVLNFLRTQGDTRYLARPRILTLNNETAEIMIQTDELIGLTPQFGGEYGTEVTGYDTERDETGIRLRVTPQVNLENGEITMFIWPTVAEATLSSLQPTTPLQGQTDYKDVEHRTTKSLVKVRDGETVIMGGLIRNVRQVTKKKVPILGDIPIIGLLFRHKNIEKNSERELVVFITPHIMKDDLMITKQESDDILFSREQAAPSEEARLLKIEATLDNFNITKE